MSASAGWKKLTLPLFLIVSFGAEISCGNQFLNHDTRHGSTSFRSSMPVDAAFSRIKSEFGFSTWVDLLSRRNARRKAKDVTFRYNDAPGEFYNMEGKVTHRYGGGYKRHVVRVLIQKEGRGSRVLIDYWITDPSITDMRDYSQSFIIRAQGALQ